MGLLNVLVSSSFRFKDDLLPPGYTERGITWVINIRSKEESATKETRPDAENSHENSEPMIIKKAKGELLLKSPATPADRTSGRVSLTLLFDKVSYVTGLPDPGKAGEASVIGHEEHESYIHLLRKCAERTNDRQVIRILQFLSSCSPYIPESKPGDLCAFQIDQKPWPTDAENVQSFWSEYVAQRLAEDEHQCVICGNVKPITRILPFKVTLMRATDPVQLSSFNLDAFQSLGKTMADVDRGAGSESEKVRKAGANAAICYSCASIAGQVLRHLVKLDKDDDGKEKSSGRHAVVLARDDSKGKGKQSLKNQIAVFWTKERVEIESKEAEKKEFEYLTKAPLEEYDDIPEHMAPAKVGQCRDLLEVPLSGPGIAAVRCQPTGFTSPSYHQTRVASLFASGWRRISSLYRRTSNAM